MSDFVDVTATKDDGKYYLSFRLDQRVEYLEHFQREGFVVIENAISLEDVERSKEEIWQYLETKAGISRVDQSTWSNEQWPKEICRNGGFMGKFPHWKRVKSLGDNLVNQQPQAWLNRQNPNIYQVFSDVIESQRLWVSVDRYGVMRPTRLAPDAAAAAAPAPAAAAPAAAGGLRPPSSSAEHGAAGAGRDGEAGEGPEGLPCPLSGGGGGGGGAAAVEEPGAAAPAGPAATAGGVVVKGEWETKNRWLHWDLNPFHGGTSAAGFAPRDIPHAVLAEGVRTCARRVQGLLNLSDNRVERGGFQCVPRFHGDRFWRWAEEHREGYGARREVFQRNFTEVPDEDPMRAEIVRVPMRAGSLLVWDSQLPHANFPNASGAFRMVQYLKMIPDEDPREFQPVLRMAKFRPGEWFPPGFRPSPLGARLLGLADWGEGGAAPANPALADSCAGHGGGERVGRWGKARQPIPGIPGVTIPVILGSQSRNRQEILEKAGWTFRQIAADIDEKAIRHPDPCVMTVMIAQAKAEALLQQITSASILITSDQVTAYELPDGTREIREKPENEEEAWRYLRSYSAGSVQTVCGVAVRHTGTGRVAVGHDVAEIFWEEIPEEVMAGVIGRGEIFSSAGGFRMEDPALAPFVQRVEGTPESIQGLPLHLVEQLVQEVIVDDETANKTSEN